MKKFVVFTMLVINSLLVSYGQLVSPPITSVNYIESEGQYLIRWNTLVNPAGSVDQYILYRFKGYNSEGVVQYIPDPTPISSSETETYIPIGENFSDVVFYAVEAVAPGGVVSSVTSTGKKPWIEDVASNIKLEVTYDKCYNKLTLKWNRYRGWGIGAAQNFEIDIRIGNSMVKIPTSSVIKDNLPEDTILVLPDDKNKIISPLNEFNVLTDTTYTFTVTVTNVGIESKGSCISNPITVTTENVKNPLYINADGADASGSKSANSKDVKLYFSTNPENQLTQYKLYRSEQLKTGYAPIADVTGTYDIQYTDASIDASLKQYYYKLVPVNNCGIELTDLESNASSIIVLKVTTEGEINRLSWTKYEDFNSDNEPGYTVRRVRNGEQDYSINAKDGIYASDDLSKLESPNLVENICYYVEALEGSGFKHNVQIMGFSNTVCLSIPFDLQVPKYFTPEAEKNKTWRPIKLPATKAYQLLIYDRWGTKVFETTDVQGVWDGKYSSGADAPQSVYLYYFKITGVDGVTREYKGNVTLVRQQ